MIRRWIGTLIMLVGLVASFQAALLTVTAWAGGWTIQPTPNSAKRPYTSLAGISCPVVSKCIAVGFYGNYPHEHTLGESWSGTGWSVQSTPTPAGPTGGALTDVACASSSMCMAVGAKPGPLTESWNGSHWTERPSANPRGTVSLRAVACPTARYCVAVGANGFGGPFAESWNGSRWVQQAVPAGVESELFGVACLSPSSCVAVGTQASGTLADVWNGRTWTQTSMPFPGPGEVLYSVACPTAGFCTAVGYHTAEPKAFSALLAEQWNGSGWTLQPFADPTAGGSPSPSLFSVSCTSPSGCTAVGDAKTALAERWTGTAWYPQEVAGANQMNSVSCPTSTSCTAVGNTSYVGDPGNSVLAAHWRS